MLTVSKGFKSCIRPSTLKFCVVFPSKCCIHCLPILAEKGTEQARFRIQLHTLGLRAGITVVVYARPLFILSLLILVTNSFLREGN